ncbi:MAG: M20/M25/M40 family metallo-hydrolase [Gemmatimonadota bacterium]
MTHFARRAIGLFALATLSVAPAMAQERVDLATVNKIRDEAMNRSQIMETMSWLTDVYGPRLTASPTTRAAAEWTMKTMAGWGVQNTHLESWPFHYTGWRNDRFALQVTGGNPFTVAAAPRAWSPAPLKGIVKGEALMFVLDSLADTAKFAGKLRGKFAMLSPVPELKAHFTADAQRLTDEELQKLAAQPLPAAGGGGFGGRPAGARPAVTRPSPNDTTFLKFLAKEGVSGILLAARGDFGTVFTDNGAPRVKNPPVVPAVHVSAEHYGRIARMLAKGQSVPMELSMQNTISPDTMSFNVMGEIPGTDPALKDEIVMLGGHFDSWHAGTGATDNAAGSAVMMEALRIFQALGLKPRRTIRIGLWTGEEQGLIGSREYVKAHYGERRGDTVFTKAEYDKFSGYFNVDNGTGKIRGVYLQGNAGVKSIFDAWLQPFWANGAQTITYSNTGGTDHQAFDGVGLPGWQFIQDPVEYGTRTHHSNQDVYERIQADDMKHNAAVVASFVWMTAQRDAKLPRKGGYVLKPAVTP